METSSTTWEQNWRKLEDKPLGKGGQGYTYLVESNQLPREKAVLKLLRLPLDPQSRGRMRRELASLQTLSSTGQAVPKVIEHNTDQFENLDVELYIVMEFISGSTLEDTVAERGSLSIEQANGLVRALAKTMTEAFKQGILHRDLKPNNIIVRNLNNSDVVIIDYGLSFNADNTGDSVTRSGETIRNSFLALPETNTPNGDQRNARSDITALCALMYYCLTGHRPGHLQDSEGKLPHLRRGYSIAEKLSGEPRLPRLEALFSRGLHPNIDLRFQSLNEFLERLAQAMDMTSCETVADPIEVAKVASARLRASDRTTQLKEFVTISQKVIQHIGDYFNQVHGKLGRFELHPSGDGTSRKMPSGIDGVEGVGNQFNLKAKHHDPMRNVVYRVGSRGEQCVLLRLNRIRKKGAPLADLFGWEEVFWFNADTTPDPALAVNDFKRWLSNAIQELDRELLPG